MTKRKIPKEKEISELLDLVLNPVKNNADEQKNVDILISQKIQEIGGKEAFISILQGIPYSPFFKILNSIKFWAYKNFLHMVRKEKNGHK